MVRSREVLLKILDAVASGPVSPSDVVSRTGLPRYMVLASFHILEALGIIQLLYGRGTYKVYVLSEIGMQLLSNIKDGKEPSELLIEYVNKEDSTSVMT